MKKCILIVGQPASGKTTKMNEILSNYSNTKTIVFSHFTRYTLEYLQSLEYIGVEEIVDLEQLYFCIFCQKVFKINFVLTSQKLPLNEVKSNILSDIEIIEL